MMASIIDKARINQRSVVITLMDMKNAFGDVQHNLIKEVLILHYVPSDIQTLIFSFYENFKASITTDSFTTPAIPLVGVSFKGTASAPFFSTCASIHLFNSYSKRNTNNLASLLMMQLIVSLILSIVSNLQMMQLWSQLTSVKINSF